MKPRPQFLLAALLALVAFLPACARVQAKAAYQDGNKAYKEENFKKAIENYELAIQYDPNMAEAYFYLGSSHQALYRPGRETEENTARLEDAIKYFQKSLEINDASTEMLKTVRANTLGALTGIFSEDPKRDYDMAKRYADELVKDDPNNQQNLYAMANLYEKFGKVAEAEEAYTRVAELFPNDPKACSALAGFFNKPLWEGKARFEEAVTTLERCAELAPNDAGGYQKVAAFYWDKAYRDPLLDNKAKEEYVEKGMTAVNKAIEIKPDYFEAVIYKGLLFRVKAILERNPVRRQQYLDEAQALQKRGLDLKKEQDEEAARAAAAAPTGN
jgi:tetratricopeptide (TPR) repeat protein